MIVISCRNELLGGKVPCTLGYTDGSLFNIKKPSLPNNIHGFIGRKNRPCINAQIVSITPLFLCVMLRPTHLYKVLYNISKITIVDPFSDLWQALIHNEYTCQVSWLYCGLIYFCWQSAPNKDDGTVWRVAGSSAWYALRLSVSLSPFKPTTLGKGLERLLDPNCTPDSRRQRLCPGTLDDDAVWASWGRVSRGLL